MEYRTRKRKPGINLRVRELRDGDNMAEAIIWNELEGRKLGGHKFVRQFPIGPYFADFLCREASLVVEIDGTQHVGSEHDVARDAFMRPQGYSVIRFWSADVERERSSICRAILAALEGSFSDDVQATDFRYVAASHG